LSFTRTGRRNVSINDPLAPEVARLVSELILSTRAELSSSPQRSGLTVQGADSSSELAGPAGNLSGAEPIELIVEHIGSTSVPDCAGKRFEMSRLERFD
jgi:hypothetical protein